MHSTLLILHSYFRWIVLLAGFVAAARMLAGWLRSLPWTESDRRAAVLFTIALDVQLLLGISLFLVSPLIRRAMSDITVAMRTADVRVFVAEHPAIMLLALALAHAGSVVTRKASTDGLKFSRGAICYGAALLLILFGIPWFRLFATTTG